MKKIFLAITLAFPLTVSAKVDFNSMIAESQKSQQELQKNFGDRAVVVKEVVARKAPQYFSDSGSDVINVPSKKEMLAFKKEKSYYRSSDTKQLDRLASEIDESGF